MTQLRFATLEHRNKKKQTKRERFLTEMDAVVPWAVLLSLIGPYDPKAGNGRRPYPLFVMLWIYFLQQWYQLSDPGAEEALYDMRLCTKLGNQDGEGGLCNDDVRLTRAGKTTLASWSADAVRRCDPLGTASY